MRNQRQLAVSPAVAQRFCENQLDDGILGTERSHSCSSHGAIISCCKTGSTPEEITMLQHLCPFIANKRSGRCGLGGLEIPTKEPATMPERWRIIFGHLASNQLANLSPAARYLVRVTSDTGKSFSGPTSFLDSWRRAVARAESPPFAILMECRLGCLRCCKKQRAPLILKPIPGSSFYGTSWPGVRPERCAHIQSDICLAFSRIA